MRELTGSERRQLLDCEQVYTAWRAADRELAVRFKGSMSWKTVAGRRYLYRKTGDVWKSLGAESAKTRSIHASFHASRETLKARLGSLDEQIRAHARILRAMQLGRVPLTAARLLRRLDRIGSLGRGLSVAGTNALYAYERLAGVHFTSDLAATLDIDLLYDARGRLDLLSSGLAETGLLGMLRGIDSSFRLTEEGSFRAANDKGFMVDLITPATRNAATRRFRQVLGDVPDDLTAVEIGGLGWLESSPVVHATAIDERGFPLMIVAPDPRAFVCHKLWLGSRADRDPLKRYRDKAQAEGVCKAMLAYLPELRFDDPALHALPGDLREAARRLAEEIATAQEGEGDWQ